MHLQDGARPLHGVVHCQQSSVIAVGAHPKYVLQLTAKTGRPKLADFPHMPLSTTLHSCVCPRHRDDTQFERAPHPLPFAETAPPPLRWLLAHPTELLGCAWRLYLRRGSFHELAVPSSLWSVSSKSVPKFQCGGDKTWSAQDSSVKCAGAVHYEFGGADRLG